MKILSLAPYKSNNDTKPNYLTPNFNTETVHFKGRKKAIELTNEKLVDSFIKNINGDLRTRVKKLMENPLGWKTFTTTLVAMAATVAETFMNTTDIVNIAEKTETKKSPQKKEAKSTIASKTEVKAKRKRYVSDFSEEELKAKLQEMANRGLSLKQMGEELGGMGISSVCKYLKKYSITKIKQPAATQKKQITIEEKYNEFIAEKPERTDFLSKLKPYKKLETMYQQIAIKSIENPKDEEKQQALKGTEKIFQSIIAFPPRYRKQYFETFEQNYSSNLDKVGLIFNNVKAGKTIQELLAEFKEHTYSDEIIDDWAKYPSFTSDELLMTKELNNKTRQNIHNLKKEGKYTFELLKDDERNNYKFILRFEKDIDLADKLKSISSFHEAIHGNIYIHKDTGNRLSRQIELKEELINLLTKDKNLNSLYNIVKFLEPEKLNSEYEGDKYLTLQKLEEYNFPIKIKLETIIKNLDETSSRYKEIEEIINDDYIFENIMSNNHAKLRFISRFVLNKEVQEGQLYDKTIDAVEYLKDDLESKINEKCCVFPYRFQESTAPCFYLAKSKLGDFIRVTLNNQGQIHTLFEDLKLKNRA